MRRSELTPQEREDIASSPRGHAPHYRPDLDYPHTRTQYSANSRRYEAPSFLEFGQACRLVHEQHILRQLKPLGLTKISFRNWMKCLRVPMIEIGRHGDRYVDSLTLQMAVKFLASLGGPEVAYVPGCRSIKHHGQSATRLNLDDLNDRMSQVINELASRHVPRTRKTTREFAKAVRVAVERMNTQIQDEMERLERKGDLDERIAREQQPLGEEAIRDVGGPVPERPGADDHPVPDGGEHHLRGGGGGPEPGDRGGDDGGSGT